MRENKRDIPNEFVAKKCKAAISLSGFDQYTALILLQQKKKKSVLLSSTLRHDNDVDRHDNDIENGKPDIIFFLE